jgi:hypothetical protein
MNHTRNVLVLAACAALTACSFISETLWPSASSAGRRAGDPPQRIAIPASPGERGAGAGDAQGGPATAVGQRANTLRDEAQRLQTAVQGRGQTLQQLRGENSDAAARYQTLVGQINARLQVGTTPGNPIVQTQWTQAQSELDRFAANIGTMSQLSNQVASDATLASYLLESVRAAYSISGAVEEDHRRLSGVEDDINRTIVSIERMRNELSEDISRQSAYVSRERASMTVVASAIRTGEFYGPGLASRSFAPQPSPPAGSTAGRRPLVTIRFDRNNPAFEQQLYAAVNRALEVRPQATFDVVGVAAAGRSGGDTAIASTHARQQAERVMRSLVDMGMPPQRLRMSHTNNPSLAFNEVQVFVR